MHWITNLFRRVTCKIFLFFRKLCLFERIHEQFRKIHVVIGLCSSSEMYKDVNFSHWSTFFGALSLSCFQLYWHVNFSEFCPRGENIASVLFCNSAHFYVKLPPNITFPDREIIDFLLDKLIMQEHSATVWKLQKFSLAHFWQIFR